MSLEEFFKLKKDKPCCKFLFKWLNGNDYNVIEISKNLHSLMVHCFIEMEHSEPDKVVALGETLGIQQQSDLLNLFVNGYMDQDNIRDAYKIMFGDDVCE